MKTIILAIALAVAAPLAAQAQIKHFLVAQWMERGNQMCKYDNGTVLNVGASICPLSI